MTRMPWAKVANKMDTGDSHDKGTKTNFVNQSMNPQAISTK